MATIQIDTLPAASGVIQTADILPIQRAGVTSKISATKLVTNRVRGVVTTAIELQTAGDIATIDLSTILSTAAGASKVIVTGAHIYDASINLSATAAATLDIRTAAAGGGISLVTAATNANIRTLTAANKVFSLVPATTTYTTVSTLYVRLTTGHGTSATVSLLLQLTELV